MANERLTRRGFVSLAAIPALGMAESQPEISITVDDVDWAGIPEPFRDSANSKLLGALKAHGNLHAALFVIGKNVDSPRGRAIVQAWSDRGHLIGNHTWSHRSYATTSISPEDFSKDILRCDGLVRAFAGFQPYFRFPVLKEGGTRERRDWMRKFLHEHGYRNGAVTVDTSDWYYDQRLMARLARDADFDVTQYREPYLNHIWNRASYYDNLARGAVGRSVRHTILLHFRLINVLFLGDLLQMFHDKGWRPIDAELSFRDEIFHREPDTVPAGESLIWALANETGRFETQLRYPGEDDVYEKPALDRLGL